MPLSSLAVRTEAWFLDETRDLGDAVALRCPSDPAYRWGNVLVLKTPPDPAERRAWEARFDEAFADVTGLRHRTFAWTGPADALGAFVDAGYEAIVRTVRSAGAGDLTRSAPSVPGLEVRPVVSADDWATVLRLQLRDHIGSEGYEAYLAYRRRRAATLRSIERGDRPGLSGSWFLAYLGDEAIGNLGLYVRGGLGRFRHVEVAREHRGRGVGTAMVQHVAQVGFGRFAAERLVITANESSGADRIYARLGFRTIERHVGATIADRAVATG